MSFDLTLDCSDDLFDTAVPVDIPAGSTSVIESFSGIPTGVTCQVDEPTLPAGWTLESIEPESVTISEEPATITVTNAAAESFPTPSPTSAEPTPAAPPFGGGLPGTGGVVPWAILGGGLLLVLAGIALSMITHRRRTGA